jgi:CTP:phosphocholine cytidylyltransferase-like protein
MNTNNLIKHINLDDLFQNRLSCINFFEYEPLPLNIKDLYNLYDEYVLKTKNHSFFTEDMFLKYFKNLSKCTSQIDGSYCLISFDENKVYLKRFVPKHIHDDWRNNVLAVNIKKFLKYKYEITDHYNR